jgi:tol-pal system protein YbgF
MRRASLHALVRVLPVATLLAACSAQTSSSERRFEDLRGLVLEQRRAIDELRREQESLRAAVDQVQYGRRPPAGRPAYGPAGGDDSYWRRPIPPATVDPEYGTVVPTPGEARDPRFEGAPAGEAGVVPALVPDPTASSPQPPAAVPAGDGIPAELVGSSFDSAMRSLSSGDHDEAIQAFRNYLHENASSAYADDAQYWIGEAYFRKGQYHRAIIELNQVAINHGSGDRAPAALLRQAEAFRIVGDRVDARLTLQKIINRYPGTGEAAKASRMLTEIGG